METTEIKQAYINNSERVDYLILSARDEAKIKPERSLDILKEAITISKNIDYRIGLANAKLNEGICQRQLSNFNGALNCFAEALNEYKELDNLDGEIKAMNSLGTVNFLLSNYDSAIEYFNLCVEKLSITGDRSMLATVYSNIGLAYQEMNNLVSSLATYYEALNILNEINKPIPHILFNNIGIVYQEIGDYSASIDYFKKALMLEEEEGNLGYQCSTLGNIGISYIKSGEFLNGVTYLGEALIIARLIGNRQAEANIYSHLGNAYKDMKSFPLAVDYKLKALKFNKEIGDRSSISHTLYQLGTIYFELNDFRSAKVSFADALETAIEAADEINEVKIYLSLAKLYNKFDDFESTYTYLKKAENLSATRNAYRELMEIHSIFNSCYKKESMYEKAIVHLELSRNYEMKLMDMDEEKKIRNMIAGKLFNENNGKGHTNGNGRSRLKNVLSLGHSMTGLRKH